jgi:hypothetical protein
MSTEPDSIGLVYLRRIDGRLQLIEDDISDMKRRIGPIEESTGALSTGYAGLQIRMDRIERRLDLHEARA